MRSLLLLVAASSVLLITPVLADESASEAAEPGESAAMPTGHPVSMPEGLTVELREIEPVECAYLEGTLFGDMDALFGKLYQVASDQDLLTDETQWGSAYPDDMSQGVDETTRVYAGITIDPTVEVAEPLVRGTLPGGTYMMVLHRGDYAQLGDTYSAVYTWAAENGIAFGTPSFEHYLTDPDSTPVEEWLTEIYFPFDHEGMKAAYADEDMEESEEARSTDD